MKKEKKLDPFAIGTAPQIPVASGCLLWLMLDRLNASGIVCGIAWSIYAYVAGCYMCGWMFQEWVHPTDLPRK